MTKPVQAKRIPGSSDRSDAASDASRKNPTPLSPSLELELGAAMERCQGSRKAAAIAWELGIDRSTYYERRKDPLSLSLRELLIVLTLDPDPRLNARIRGHLSVLDSHQAIAEEEAGESYIRVGRRAQARFAFEGDR